MNNANEMYLNSIKNMYDSLQDFSITNNVLHYKNFQLPLMINLNAFNPALFILTPEEIMNTLYVFQLLYKSELNEQEKQTITNYTNLYYKYTNDPNVSNNTVFGISIPIYTAYEDAFTNSPASIIIRDLLNSKSQSMVEYASSISNQVVRTLKKDDLPNTEAYLEYQEFSDKLNKIQNAGFTTIFLIVFAVIATITTLIIIT